MDAGCRIEDKCHVITGSYLTFIIFATNIKTNENN